MCVIPVLKKEHDVKISAMSMTTCHQRNSLQYKWYKWKDTMTVRCQSNTNRIQMALNALWREKRQYKVAGLKNTCNDNSNDKTNRKNYRFKKYLNITKQSD